MAIDNANYVSELDVNLPNGNVDTVSQLDDSDRAIKRALVQSFPNINKQTTITSDELNYIKNNLKIGSTGWDMNNQTITNVQASDTDNGVEPRWYNDQRYLQGWRSLDDVPNPNWAMANLFNKISVGDGTLYGSAFMAIVNDMAWPIGSIYENTINASNPHDILHIGTWIPWGEGRVIVGAGQTTDSRGETRGFSNRDNSGEFQHVLSVEEMPAHNHTIGHHNDSSSSGPGISGNAYPTSYNSTTSTAGANYAHNNMMPYTTVYRWVRTA